MINTGDKLICMDGNTCYVEGEVYTVGSIVNEKFFEISTGSNGGHWYATEDNEGIYVRFNSMKDKVNDARFAKIERQAYA
ncbi:MULTISPECIES: hypothetical protein [Psychrobacter]|uniref:hypothetical protein n=1 Tax=Psychrobacter TaxID=497 RepID=UPI00191AAB65|nr:MULTISPECIES: hypothetical protein [Psychrobacter]